MPFPPCIRLSGTCPSPWRSDPPHTRRRRRWPQREGESPFQRRRMLGFHPRRIRQGCRRTSGKLDWGRRRPCHQRRRPRHESPRGPLRRPLAGGLRCCRLGYHLRNIFARSGLGLQLDLLQSVQHGDHPSRLLQGEQRKRGCPPTQLQQLLLPSGRRSCLQCVCRRRSYSNRRVCRILRHQGRQHLAEVRLGQPRGLWQ